MTSITYHSDVCVDIYEENLDVEIIFTYNTGKKKHRSPNLVYIMVSSCYYYTCLGFKTSIIFYLEFISLQLFQL